MAGTEEKPERLSLWWRNSVILVMACRVCRPDMGERPLLRGRPAHSGARG